MTLQHMTIKSYRAAMRDAALRYRVAVSATSFSRTWNSRMAMAITALRTALFYRSLARKLEAVI